MIAVDTNILVYAHVDGFAKHPPARDLLLRLARGSRPWGIPTPCMVEFLRIVTHRRILADPFPVSEAVEALRAVLEAPTVHVLCPGEQHWAFLSAAATEADARGNLVFDAAIAAVCREVGVTELVTEDRDFHRFEGLEISALEP